MEVCKALQTMGYPQDKRPQMCLVDYGSGYGSVQPYYAQDDLMPFGQPWIACPSELEALDWLEDETAHPGWSYKWARGAEPIIYEAFWWGQERRGRVGRTENPLELILAISEDWEKRQDENTR